MNFSIANGVEPEFIALMNSIPKELRSLDGIDEIDPFKLAKDYFRAEDVSTASIDPNANVSGKSPVHFHMEIFKPLSKLRAYYLLWKSLLRREGAEVANTILTQMCEGLLYFHDVTKIDVPYCFALDASFMATAGRPYGWLPSSPPTNLKSFMGQLREVIMDFSQYNAGAIGVANALVLLAFYSERKRTSVLDYVYLLTQLTASPQDKLVMLVKQFIESEEKQRETLKIFEKECVENNNLFLYNVSNYLVDKEIENEIQQTVHVLHNTFRIGGDSPFTNISLFDEPTLVNVFSGSVYPDGSSVLDNLEEIMRVQRIYAQFFAKGSPVTGKPYRFPVTTINVKTSPRGRIIDTEFFNFMADLNRERGVFNWHKGDKIASCCRLTSDLSALKEQIRMDSFGNGGVSIGSHRVVSVNIHQAALRAIKNNTSIFEELDRAMLNAEKLLIVHKLDILKKRIEGGLLKFFNLGWAHLNMFFSTFGFTGLYDSFLVINKGEFSKEKYIEYASQVLEYLENYAKNAGKKHEGFAFNVEEIPAESAAVKLASKDNFLFGTNIELLSNQMIPLYVDFDVFERIEISSALMNKVSGGAILHLNIDDKMTVGANRELTRRLIEDFNIPHFALNRGFSTCSEGHTTIGVVQACAECGAGIVSYTTRVVGFFTDTKDWVSARRNFEFSRRKWYKKGELLRE